VAAEPGIAVAYHLRIVDPGGDMRNRTVLVATLLALSVLATACTSATSSSAAAPPASSSPSATGSPVPTSPAPATDMSGKASFTIDAYDDFFSPNVLMGSANQKLSLTIDNKGAAVHTFTITSGENVDVTLMPGTSQTVDVTFPKSGSTQFVCRFHESMGMVGQLQVQ
jgi:plastocyanin